MQWTPNIDAGLQWNGFEIYNTESGRVTLTRRFGRDPIGGYPNFDAAARVAEAMHAAEQTK